MQRLRISRHPCERIYFIRIGTGGNVDTGRTSNRIWSNGTSETNRLTAPNFACSDLQWADLTARTESVQEMRMEIYLDNNATTRSLPDVGKAMLRMMEVDFGNASSSHRSGERVRKHLFVARDRVSKLFGCLPENILFGSCATELNNLVIKSFCRDSHSHLVTTQVEHPSVLRVAEEIECVGGKVTYLAVDHDGLIDIKELQLAITDQTSLVSIQWCNSETGVFQNIERIADVCVQKGVWFHCDAAQAIGKTDVAVRDLPVDFLTCSAHKIHGPQGIGAAYCRTFSELKPMLVGGSQELGQRAGTENIPGIVGFGVAAKHRHERFQETNDLVQGFRNRFESKVLETITFARINGSRKVRNGNTSNICFCGIDGQALVASLDQRGVRCSQSSACSSQIPEPSHVLRAMGLSEQDAYSSVRFSFSEMNLQEEVDLAADLVTKRVNELVQNTSTSFV